MSAIAADVLIPNDNTGDYTMDRERERYKLLQNGSVKPEEIGKIIEERHGLTPDEPAPTLLERAIGRVEGRKMTKFRILTTLLVFPVFCLSLSEAMCQDMERRVIEALAPPYDDITLQARWEGTIRLEASVGPSGEVQHVQVVDPALPSGWRNKHWEEYAREWRFESNETSTIEEIVFRFRFVPPDSTLKDRGTVFIAPATVEIRHPKLRPATSHAVPGSGAPAMKKK